MRSLPATVLGLTLGSFHAGAAAEPSPPVTGREAVDRFVANIRSFPHYTCKFTVTRAEAATFDDALAGRWARSVSTDCVLRVDGAYEAWTGRNPQRTPATRRRGSGPPPAAAGRLWLPDFDYVGDSRVGLTDAQGMDGAWNLLPTNQWFEPVRAPLGAGHGRKLRAVGNPDAHEGDPEWEFADEGLAGAAGRQLASVRLTHSWVDRLGTGFRQVERFHLDPSRGYLPAWHSLDVEPNSTLDGRPANQWFVLTARDCGSGRWFPERVISVGAPFGAGQPYSVAELRVTELDVARPPDVELAVALPGGSLVVSGSDPRKRLRIGSPQTIRARNLADLEADLDATVPPPGLLSQMLPGPRGWRWLAMGLGAAVLLLGMGFVWRSRRKPGADQMASPRTD